MALTVVEVKKTSDLQPAAMHETEAAKYLGMNRHAFRDLILSGRIPFSEHVNGKRRIFLRSDLDDYLASLNWRKMAPRENSRAALKGVAKK